MSLMGSTSSLPSLPHHRCYCSGSIEVHNTTPKRPQLTTFVKLLESDPGPSVCTSIRKFALFAGKISLAELVAILTPLCNLRVLSLQSVALHPGLVQPKQSSSLPATFPTLYDNLDRLRIFDCKFDRGRDVLAFINLSHSIQDLELKHLRPSRDTADGSLPLGVEQSMETIHQISATSLNHYNNFFSDVLNAGNVDPALHRKDFVSGIVELLDGRSLSSLHVNIFPDEVLEFDVYTKLISATCARLEELTVYVKGLAWDHAEAPSKHFCDLPT